MKGLIFPCFTSMVNNPNGSPSLDIILDNLGFSQYSNLFCKEEITLSILSLILEEQLCHVGVSCFGQRFCILEAVMGLQNNANDKDENGGDVEENGNENVGENIESREVVSVDDTAWSMDGGLVEQEEEYSVTKEAIFYVKIFNYLLCQYF